MELHRDEKMIEHNFHKAFVDFIPKGLVVVTQCSFGVDNTQLRNLQNYVKSVKA